MNFIFSFLLASVMWVQVPQWEADWSKCAVDVPDSSCHWYVAAPDNTFGEGFNWEDAPWFDANGLQDVAKICLLYTSPSPRDATLSRMPSSA